MGPPTPPPSEPPSDTPAASPPEPGAPLADGDYDAFIVWVEERDGALVFELALMTGDDRGAVYNVVAAIRTEADPVALVGLPCTLRVRDSQPRVVL